MRGAGGAIVSKTNKFMASHGNFFNLALGYKISFARSHVADGIRDLIMPLNQLTRLRLN